MWQEQAGFSNPHGGSEIMRADLNMIVPAGPTTQEGAALTLLQIIANCEGKSFSHAAPKEGETVDRAWVLDTFTECLKAARYQR
jgi:hypothetical protein